MRGKSMALAWVALLVVAGAVPVSAQSGRGTMVGWVDFEGVGRNRVAEARLVARVQLIRIGANGDDPPIETDTDEIGGYKIELVPAGEFTVRITAPGYRTYEAEIYIPSDFECRLATALKKERAATTNP